jgi:hypothetical protein
VALTAVFSFVMFVYAACATMFLALPADVFDSLAVATVSGLSGPAPAHFSRLTSAESAIAFRIAGDRRQRTSRSSPPLCSSRWCWRSDPG